MISMQENKYRNKRIIVDGYEFDSRAEAKRYQELLLIEEKAADYSYKLSEEMVHAMPRT